MTSLVDTHCHLGHAAFDADREAVIARALEELAWIVVIGDDVESSLRAADSATERVYATVGIHPHAADRADAAALAAIRDAAARPGVVAIGEIGLDYHYDFSPRDRQREVFQRQLEMAAELRVPVVLHCREAEPDFIARVEPMQKDLAGGVMHCFGGDVAFAERCLSWNFFVSFAGNVTFPKANSLREAARIVPMDRILVETDSPYLAPQAVRGKRCEPIYVRHTAVLLAELKGVLRDEFARQTAANAGGLFGV